MNDNELYESLAEKGIPESDINQFLKSRHDGYDIYNYDIRISTDKLRSFRKFLLENLKPEFSHGQLREIELGYIKGIDVMQYANPKYKKEQMRILRKNMENNIDINIIKKYGYDTKSMQVIGTALRYVDETDIKQYKIDQLELLNEYFRKKIDIRPYLDLNFGKKQIKSILFVKKYYGIDINKYVDYRYDPDLIEAYGKIVSKNSIYEIKNLFDPRYSIHQLKILDKEMTNSYWKELANPNYSCSKMLLLAKCLKEHVSRDIIDIIKDSNSISDRRYMDIHSNITEFDKEHAKLFFSSEINNDEYDLIHPKTNLKLFNDLRKNGYSVNAMDAILNCEEQGIDVTPYITNKMLVHQIENIARCISLMNDYNKSDDIPFVLKSYLNENQINILEYYLKKGLDYKRIDSWLSQKQVNQISGYNNPELFYVVKPTFTRIQIKVCNEALKSNIPLDNLLKEGLDHGVYSIILSLEKFNKNNERQINISELVNLDLDIATMGKLASELMSNDLDKNLNAYKTIADLTIKDKNTERNIER